MAIGQECRQCANLVTNKDAALCRPCLNDRARQYYKRPEVRARKKAYCDKNKEQIIANKTQYRLENPDKVRKVQRDCHNNRKAIDFKYVIERRMRSLISKAFKNAGYSKKSKTYKLIGLCYQECVEYLEASYKSRYGHKPIWKDCHVDHIIPLSSAKTEEDLVRLNHHTNLQLLTAEDNLKKGNKYGIR